MLATSDLANLGRVDIHPNTNTLVFAKATGEFGIVLDGKVEVLMENSRFSAPRFSPDGKHILLLKNQPIEQVKPQDSNSKT